MRAACAFVGYSRLGSCLLIVGLTGAGVGGCAGVGPTTQLPLITLGIEEPARWIEPADLRRYQCELGSLICTSAAGRLTTRLCRCVVSAGDIANPLPQADVGR
jgi:hypothetical protein